MQRAVLHSAGQSWQINSQGENIRIKLRDRIDLWSIALTRPQQRNGTQEPPRTSVFVNEHQPRLACHEITVPTVKATQRLTVPLLFYNE
mmetsp:Transcript_8162/g.17312  ORF Transcript_8162/g.17312 Transcript_8162/m.17312 type:complete len:89 (-) Transcript_8162:1581-1847(-)